LVDPFHKYTFAPE